MPGCFKQRWEEYVAMPRQAPSPRVIEVQGQHLAPKGHATRKRRGMRHYPTMEQLWGSCLAYNPSQQDHCFFSAIAAALGRVFVWLFCCLFLFGCLRLFFCFFVCACLFFFVFFVCFFLFLLVCLFVCLLVCLFACLFVWRLCVN